MRPDTNIIIALVIIVFVAIAAYLFNKHNTENEVARVAEQRTQVKIIFAYRREELESLVNMFLRKIKDTDPKVQIIMTEPDDDSVNSYKYAIITYKEPK